MPSLMCRWPGSCASGKGGEITYLHSSSCNSPTRICRNCSQSATMDRKSWWSSRSIGCAAVNWTLGLNHGRPTRWLAGYIAHCCEQVLLLVFARFSEFLMHACPVMNSACVSVHVCVSSFAGACVFICVVSVCVCVRVRVRARRCLLHLPRVCV